MNAAQQAPKGEARSYKAASGFTMIEVLITILILTLGMLGLAAMLGRAFASENESYQRAQATAILDDLVDRISANRLTAPCFVQTFGAGATLSLCSTFGLTATDAIPTTDLVLASFQEQILGASVVKGATNVGGLAGAQACVVREGTEALYFVAIAWQGTSEIAVPAAPTGASAALIDAVACGAGDYGTSDALRRVIWTSIRIADLV